MNETIKKTIERKILLNPGPATTSIRVKESLIVEDICPREEEFGELVTNIRSKIKDVVNADETYEGVLLGCSGTGAIEACLSSCANSEDTILIIENGAYGKRMKQICDALGIKSESLKFEWGSEIDWQLLREHLASSKIKFKVVSLVHHETTTGILNSLSELCKIAKEYNLRTLVDAMSSYAGIKIDLTVNSVEYLISSSNKCIQGMAGVGIVIAKRDELERIKIFKKRSYYFDLFSNYNSQKERKQFLFTPPVQTLYALNAALDEFFEEGGIDFRSAKYSELYDLMLKGLNDIGFKALLDQRNNSKILTTFLEPLDDKFSFKGMHKYLFERGITIYPGKIDEKDTFRISNIGHLTREDIVKFLHLVKEYLSTEGIELN